MSNTKPVPKASGAGEPVVSTIEARNVVEGGQENAADQNERLDTEIAGNQRGFKSTENGVITVQKKSKGKKKYPPKEEISKSREEKRQAMRNRAKNSGQKKALDEEHDKLEGQSKQLNETDGQAARQHKRAKRK